MDVDFCVEVGKAGGTVLRRRVEELLGRQGLLWAAVRPLLEVREKVRREIAALYRKLLGLARDDVDSRRSMTVPGIGPITALAFRSAIDEPSRFRRSRSVGAYFGLTPRRHASGEVDWTGRISKCGDRMLRTYLFEAAGVLLTRVPQWCKPKALAGCGNASASRRPRPPWRGSWRFGRLTRPHRGHGPPSACIGCGAMEPTSSGQARR